MLFTTFHFSIIVFLPTLHFLIYILPHHRQKFLVNSFKGCLSGIQFFHKFIYGSPSPHIANSQTVLLISGIQKTHPIRQDTRYPITQKTFTKCISTLRKGYGSIQQGVPNIIISGFNPNIHPTISNLVKLDNETLSLSIFLLNKGKPF